MEIIETNEVLEKVIERITEMRMGEADSDLRSLVSFVESLKTNLEED